MPKADNIAPALSRFGASVRRERVRAGLTQEALAEAAGLNPRTVQKIEAGQLNILLTTLIRIRKALRCEWSALIRE